METCTFCDIYEEGKDIIYDNDSFFSRFDLFPVSPGHAEIVPKRHLLSITDLTEEEWGDLKEAITKTLEEIKSIDLKTLYLNYLENPLNENSERFCRKMLEHDGVEREYDGYNLGINEGEAAGRTVNHLHIHIIPRYEGDVEDKIGGVRHILPGMGNYRK